MSGRRDYYLLLAGQTLSAFGDNACRAIILGQLTFQQQQGLITDAALQSANAIYTSILFIPYVLLAPLAGYFNDRFPKTRWLFGGNALKLTGALLALIGLVLGQNWQGAAYLIIGIGACVYSPAKYGILPEILPRERLVKANGTMEMMTLVAILAGNIAGAALIDRFPAVTCFLLLLGVYGLAQVCNLLMATSPSHPATKLAATFRDFGGQLGALLGSPRLKRVLLGTGLFWIAGAVMQMNFQPWGLTVLGLQTNEQIALLGLWLSLGIAGGSVLSGQLYKVGDLRGTRRWGWALAGLVAFLTLVGGKIAVPIVLVLVGFAGGLYLIPLNAALQAESHRGALGKTIAIQNFIENFAMLCGGGLLWVAVTQQFSPLGVFLGLAAFLAVAVWWLRIPPLTSVLIKGENSSFPPRGGRLGWGGHSTPTPPSPVKGEGAESVREKRT